MEGGTEVLGGIVGAGWDSGTLKWDGGCWEDAGEVGLDIRWGEGDFLLGTWVTNVTFDIFVILHMSIYQ